MENFEQTFLKLLKENHSDCNGDICREYNQVDILFAVQEFCQLICE